MSNSFLPQQSAQGTREDQAYAEATNALNNRNYQDAAAKFSQIAQAKGRKADAALYWNAYALNKMGNRTDAASAIAELRAQYPKSTWLKDATAMEMEWRGGAPSEGVHGGVRGGVPGGISSGNGDDDLKSQALFGLMNNDPDRGVPICEDILKNPNQSPRLKERALFLLAQNDSPKAQEVVLGVAKGNSGPELQIRAIHQLGVSGDRYIPALTQIYSTTTDANVKKAVLSAYMTSDAKGELLKAIATEKDPEMRRRAIRQLGPMGASKELEQLYNSTQSPDDQEAIIQALAITGDTSLLSKIAKTGANADVRKRAIRSLGITGDNARPTLLDIYNTDKDPDIRRTVTDALFVSGACADMVSLARRETDPEVKKRLVEKIALMDCKEGRDYMMELLK
ncbi:MAG: HEAT repeat domain-containing protein [Terriglobales bacterium]